MLLAIDYDETITLDVKFWLAIIQFARANGHEVVCVTGREESEPIPEHVSSVVEVVYAGNKLKSKALKDTKWATFSDVVWVDDSPGHIEPSRKLRWD